MKGRRGELMFYIGVLVVWAFFAARQGEACHGVLARGLSFTGYVCVEAGKEEK